LVYNEREKVTKPLEERSDDKQEFALREKTHPAPKVSHSFFLQEIERRLLILAIEWPESSSLI